MRVDNWYWFIGSDKSQVFSSAQGILVPLYSPDYAIWRQSNVLGASTIASYSELFDLLSTQAPASANLVGTSWAQLGYLTTAQSLTAYINNGVTVVSSGSPSMNGTYPLGIIAILGYNVAKAQLLNGSLSFPEFFPDVSGVPHSFPTSGAFNLFFTNIIGYYSSIQALGAGQPGQWPTPVISF